MSAQQTAQIQRLSGQTGAVLPVALIMLLIISLLAVAGMSDTTLQERMAGSLRDRDIAFQAAEAALRRGEQWIDANPLLAGSAAEMDPQVALQWNGSSPAATGVLGALYDNNAGISLSGAPAFHVGPPQLLRVSVELGSPPIQIHPVTARASGATDTAIVILRSTYRSPVGS